MYVNNEHLSVKKYSVKQFICDNIFLFNISIKQSLNNLNIKLKLLK